MKNRAVWRVREPTCRAQGIGGRKQAMLSEQMRQPMSAFSAAETRATDSIMT